MKAKTVFYCTECGNETPKWQGRCPACGAWNTVVERPAEQIPRKGGPARGTSGIGVPLSRPKSMEEVEVTDELRFRTGMGELDRVLGGGAVRGSLVLVGGAPGIGKSTLMLQICDNLCRFAKVLYVSGEESERQIKLRAQRLNVAGEELYLLSETNLEHVLDAVHSLQPDVLIVDSIQTLYHGDISSGPGSISQVKECTMSLMQLAKGEGITVFVIGHVNKEGSIAGPKVLEHMVDTVLYFEGERVSSLRLLRAIKNRFGSTNELGVFEMSGSGLIPLADPTGVFLSQHENVVSGSTVGCALQGSRPVMLEIQALATPSNFGNPRRLASGIDYNRLLIIIAVLEKKVGLNLSNQDVYLNVIGGLKVDDPAIDLAIAAAIVSSYREVPIPSHTVVMGEIGLTGELRPAGQTARRLAEIKKLGFSTAIAAKEKGINKSGAELDLTLYQADSLQTALSYMGF